MKQRSTKSGFTLLEVTLSLVILGLSLVVIYQIFTNTVTSYSRVKSKQSYQEDLGFVRKQVLKLPKIDNLEKGGNVVTPDEKKWQWEASASPTEVLDLFELTIIIKEDKEQSLPHKETLYLLRPTWTPASERQSQIEELQNNAL